MAGLRPDLQHARQQQTSDQRHARQLRPGLRRPRRRCRLSCASVVDFRSYYEVVSDLVGILHLQGGDMLGLTNCPADTAHRAAAMCACSTTSRWARTWSAASSRPASVRVTSPPARQTTLSAARMYWGASLEFQYPFYFLPKDAGFRGAVFIDSGSEWGYQGETPWPANGEVNGTITTSTASPVCLRQLRHAIRRHRGAARVRRRQHHLGFAVRSAAVRFRLSDPETAVRPHPIVPVRRRNAVLIAAATLVKAGACRTSSQSTAS